MKMYCAGCGRDRTVGAAAADPGPCPSCQSTIRSSVKPVFGRVNAVVQLPKFTFNVGEGFVTPGGGSS